MPRYLVTIDGVEYDIDLEYRAEGFEARLNGQAVSLSRATLGDSRALLLVDGRSVEVDVRNSGYDGECTAFLDGQEIPVQIDDYNLARLRRTVGLSGGSTIEKKLKAPMPGLVLALKVAPGDTVAKGQPLVIIEAMKMENVLKAPSDGVVKSIAVTAGKSVEKNDLLLELD